jgi:XapX domain-containing protein
MDHFIAICKDPLFALATGLFVGILFSAFKLPIPAPPALPGILGIVGIYLGGILWKAFT